jgi:hypothetical protein
MVGPLPQRNNPPQRDTSILPPSMAVEIVWAYTGRLVFAIWILFTRHVNSILKITKH